MDFNLEERLKELDNKHKQIWNYLNDLTITERSKLLSKCNEVQLIILKVYFPLWFNDSSINPQQHEN